MKKKDNPKTKESEEMKRLLEKVAVGFIGIGGEKLVDLLYERQNVNEFLIAKKLEMTINQTRNILYKLADEGLVEFIRKKDKKKGGWYIYFWTLKAKKALAKFRESLEKEIHALKTHLGNLQSGRHFYCKNCGTEYPEEEAMLHEFACPECGEIMAMKETREIENNLKRDIDKFSKSLEEINKKISVIGEKEQKTRERKQKVELKKKEGERKKRRVERAKEKDKLKKSEAKKKQKKTPKKTAKKSKKEKRPQKKKIRK